MKIQVVGEDPTDRIDVVGGAPSMVVQAYPGLVWSVMGQTGAVTGLALATDVVAAQAAAEAAAAADATAKVAAHVAATDPHGDRAYAISLTDRGVTDWINVTRAPYNAAGDGTTDDTTAIQTAIDEATADGGKTIYLPAGTYKLTAQLALGDGITILGAGPTASILQQTSTTAHALAGADIQNLTVSNLGITGPGSGSGSGIRLTVDSNPCTPYLTLQDLTITDMGGSGVSAELPIVSAMRRVVAESCGGWGFDLFGQVSGGQPPGTSCALESCFANNCGTGGYNLYKLAYCTLTGCAADANPVGYLLDTAYSVTLTGCGAEGNTTAGIRVSGGYGAALHGIFVYNNLGIGIHVTGSAHIVNLSQVVDVTPGGTATRFIQVDAGSYATVTGMSNTTANLFSGSVNILDDGANGVVLAGYTYIGNSLEVANDLYVDAGGVYVSGGDVVVSTTGRGLRVKEGANAKMGTATLNGTTGVVVSTTAVTANSRIFLTPQAGVANAGFLSVLTRTAGNSFTIASSNASDARSVAWMIVEPV